jgi:hypothetical protein
MPTTPPPFVFDHIPTKHKEAIRELHGFEEKLIAELMEYYKLGKTIIHRVLVYDAPEQARPGRIGRPQLLTDIRVNKIIEYCTENWEQWTIDY